VSIGVVLGSQSSAQTVASNMNGLSEAQKSYEKCPLVLKADSEAIVEMGMTRKSGAK
jgi:hypothetical protein